MSRIDKKAIKTTDDATGVLTLIAKETAHQNFEYTGIEAHLLNSIADGTNGRGQFATLKKILTDHQHELKFARDGDTKVNQSHMMQFSLCCAAKYVSEGTRNVVKNTKVLVGYYNTWLANKATSVEEAQQFIDEAAEEIAHCCTGCIGMFSLFTKKSDEAERKALLDKYSADNRHVQGH